MASEEPMNLINLIAKSSVHLIVFEKQTNKPIQYGSGCIASYKNKLFAISVNHVTQIRGKETYTLIETGLPSKDGQTPYYRLGELVYFDVFKAHGIDTGDFNQMTFSKEEPLDITFTTLKDEVFLKQKGFTYYGQEITEGQKVFLNLDYSTEPKQEDYFGFFGHIKHDIFDDQIIKSKVTFKIGLSYKGTHDRFHLFYTPDIIKEYEDYAGTSGAPILNEEGQLVGLVCSVIKNSHSLFAFPVDYCKQLIDISLESGLL